MKSVSNEEQNIDNWIKFLTTPKNMKTETKNQNFSERKI